MAFGRIIQTKNNTPAKGAPPKRSRDGKQTADPAMENFVRGIVDQFAFDKMMAKAGGVLSATPEQVPPVAVAPPQGFIPPTPVGAEPPAPAGNPRLTELGAQQGKLRTRFDEVQNRQTALESAPIEFDPYKPFTEPAPTPTPYPGLPADDWSPEQSALNRVLPYLGVVSMIGGPRIAPKLIGAYATGLKEQHDLRRKEEVMAVRNQVDTIKENNQAQLDIWAARGERNDRENAFLQSLNIQKKDVRDQAVSLLKAEGRDVTSQLNRVEDNIARERRNLFQNWKDYIGSQFDRIRPWNTAEQVKIIMKDINKSYDLAAQQLGMPRGQVVSEIEAYARAHYGMKENTEADGAARIKAAQIFAQGSEARAKLQAKTQVELAKMANATERNGQNLRYNTAMMNAYLGAYDRLMQDEQFQQNYSKSNALAQARLYSDQAQEQRKELSDLSDSIYQDLLNADLLEADGNTAAAARLRAQAQTKANSYNTGVTIYNDLIKKVQAEQSKLPELEDDVDIQQIRRYQNLQWNFLERMPISGLAKSIKESLPTPTGVNRPAAAGRSRTAAPAAPNKAPAKAGVGKVVYIDGIAHYKNADGTLIKLGFKKQN